MCPEGVLKAVFWAKNTPLEMSQTAQSLETISNVDPEQIHIINITPAKPVVLYQP